MLELREPSMRATCFSEAELDFADIFDTEGGTDGEADGTAETAAAISSSGPSLSTSSWTY
jgi:hypothetical protein